MNAFLTSNAPAIFALAGVIFGTLVTGMISYLSVTKEMKLRLTEKLLDKKLAAHESLLNIVGLIRTMILAGGEDEKGELKRHPLIMDSKVHMSDFLDQFNAVHNTAERWLSSPIKKEVSFFLDYFVNLNEHSRNSSDEALRESGVIIRDDFIDIALRLENCAHVFFNKDMLKLNYKTDRNWHKYSTKETLKKLDETEFYKNKKRVMNILHGRT